MAMQAALSSRILLIGGAGYIGTVLVNKGKLSDLIGELQAFVKGIEKGKTDGDSSDSSNGDAVAQQVKRLAQEIRQLASARQITVLNANGQSVNLTGLIVPAASLGAVGYAYMWWKGIKFSDLMYVTKQSMAAAVSNLTKHLEDVTSSLAKAKEHLTQRIQGLDDKMDTQKEISKAIQNEVKTINGHIQGLGSELLDLNLLVEDLGVKLGSLDQKQQLANMGIDFLCDFARGKKSTMPKVLEDHLGSGKNRITFHQGSGITDQLGSGKKRTTFHEGSGITGLKALTDDTFGKLVINNLARISSVPTDPLQASATA